MNPPQRPKKQCLGIPAFDTESLVVDPDTFRVLPPGESGEIVVRGPQMLIGYWKKEEATKKEFTADGWFKTGDIGKIEHGFLSITDRKKELLKTSGGKYIAPQPIEGKLKADALVGNAAVVGDSRKFASVLISPNFQACHAAQNAANRRRQATRHEE